MNANTETAKYTPGPWRFQERQELKVVGQENHEVGISIYDVGHNERSNVLAFVLRRCGGEDWREREKEAEANAQLIANAPELLESAKLTVLHFKRNHISGNFQGDDEHEAWTTLEKAIAKAEGR